MSFSYRAYGLRIESSIRISGLVAHAVAKQSADLCFKSGEEPQWAIEGRTLPGCVRSCRPESEDTGDPRFVLTEHGAGECFELSYSDGTRFVVDSTGSRVWGTFEPPLTPEDLATYFLGPVMGFLLRQRFITCLHASAVELRSRAVALCGDAGMGKSTTAAALALRGAPVLNEDILPLQVTRDGCDAIPGYPRVCLWPDSVMKLLGAPEALPKLTPVWEKRYLPLDGERARFSDQTKRLGMIYLFGERSSDENAPRIEELRPREALLELVKNTYMNWLLDREQRASEFDELCQVVNRVPIRRIVAHRDAQRIGALCELIQGDVESSVATS